MSKQPDPKQNHLLAALPEEEFGRIGPDLELVKIRNSTRPDELDGLDLLLSRRSISLACAVHYQSHNKIIMRPAINSGAFVVLCGILSIPAIAGPIHCEGEYGDVELDGDLEVAQRCVLQGTEVDGRIRLYEGGSLLAIDAEIDGNLEAKRADFVDIRNSEIEGNLVLEEMVGDVSYITDSTISGKINVRKNRSQLELRRNYVDDRMDVIDNSGGVFITDNVIDGNLKCDKNSPAPVLDNNSVAGKTEKQCNQSAPNETPTDSDPDTGDGGDDTGGDETGGDDTGGDDTPVGGNEPPVLNVGTGGGGSVNFVLLLFLLAGRLSRVIKRDRTPQKRPA